MRRATTITSRPGLSRLAAISAVAFVLGMAVRGYVAGDSSADGNGGAHEQPTPSTPTPGPTEYVDGIPSGFARTSDGARAAAVHFVLTGRTVIGMVPPRVPDAIRSMAAIGSADSQVAEAQEQLRLLLAIPHAQVHLHDEGHTWCAKPSFGRAVLDACLSADGGR